MTYETLKYTLDGHVAEVRLDQPEKHNPLSEATSLEFVDALERARDDESVRAVLLTGAGEAFSAGGDIREFAEHEEKRATEIFEEGKATAELFKLLTEYRKPLVGAVNGHAFGGGVGLVAACNVAYAAEDARVGTTEIELGLFPLVILPVLRRAVGDRKALELALTGQRLGATDAADIGLVTEVVPPDEVEKAARNAAREIANRSPLATSLGLHAFHQTTGMSPAEAIDTLNAYRVLFYQSHDLHEGAQAFLADREPEWEGY